MRTPPPSPVTARLRRFALAALFAGSIGIAPARGADFDPPGFPPRSAGYHALVGGTVVTAPGREIPHATLVISNGLFLSVTAGEPAPTGARRWDMTGRTLFPGFIDPYVPVSAPPAAPGAAPGEPDSDPRAPQEREAGPRFFGVPGQERDPGAPGPGAASRRVTPEFRAALAWAPTAKTLDGFHELGFTAAHVVPADGLVRGQSALIALGNASPNASVLKADVAQCVGFDPGSGDGAVPAPYPGSLMGAVAAVRQAFLDARYHQALQAFATKAGPGAPPRLPLNVAWEALAPALSEQPILFDAGSVLMNHRATVIARELGLSKAMFLATGQEWRRPDLVTATGGPFILPLTHPALPKITSEVDWEDVTLDQLRAWDWAPETPAVLAGRGVSFALTSHGLPERKEFRKNLAAALGRGLSPSNALHALTVAPAQLAGMGHRLGTIEPGKLAFLTITEGDYFAPTSRVHSIWADGIPFLRSATPPPPAASATHTPSTNSIPPFPKPPVQRVALSPQAVRGPLQQPPAVLVRGATVWTCGPAGILTNASLLVRAGRVEAVGRISEEAADRALVVDGTGLHVTPGLIDAHSHSAILGNVNEPTLPSTAMVRIEDVVNSESPEIQRQLAGGLTVANLLHGSANPIGGQNAVIKLRDGAAPEALRFASAPAGIKFALGENVKQSNWGERQVTRFPQSRMGVPTFFANRFAAARQYRDERRRRDADPSLPPVRQDLELDALVEILEGRRLIHCHSYRQDEIVAFLRTMESFGVRVATLQHVLEGYKVADEIARHGAGASTFSDWWAFKMEVIDAIPYAGSLMHARGVLVSFNSDSSDHARRLNLEAAKAVKYGGTPESEALLFVTLNPARQLRIDDRVGSLEPGKDGDFVLWSGPPLDSRSVCLQTWIDGVQYFDRDAQAGRTRRLTQEREDLLAKARSSSASGGALDASNAARARFFQKAWEQSSHLGISECLDCVALTTP